MGTGRFRQRCNLHLRWSRSLLCRYVGYAVCWGGGGGGWREHALGR